MVVVELVLLNHSLFVKVTWQMISE